MGWLCLDYENFYPKNKKEIPEGKEQKSESKGKLRHVSFALYNCKMWIKFLCLLSRKVGTNLR